MAARTLLSPPVPLNTLQGTTITELETLVEHTILHARPLLSVAEIRVLLHVWDACENCEATGTINARGYESDHVTQERCPDCKGKGYVVPENEAVQQ